MHHNCSNDKYSCDIENIFNEDLVLEPYIDVKMTYMHNISNSKCRVIIVEMFNAHITSHSKAHF